LSIGGRPPLDGGGPPRPFCIGGRLLSSYASLDLGMGGCPFLSKFLGSSGGALFVLGGGPMLNCIVGICSPCGGPFLLGGIL